MAVLLSLLEALQGRDSPRFHVERPWRSGGHVSHHEVFGLDLHVKIWLQVKPVTSLAEGFTEINEAVAESIRKFLL